MGMATFTPREQRTIAAFAMIGIGLLMLVGFGALWPLLILLPGLALLAFSNYAHPAASPLAIPAMLTAGTGAILLFQSVTGYWESWIYAWTLYGVFLGVGLMMMGKRLREDSLAQVGRVMAWISGAVFAVFGGFVILLTSSVFQWLVIAALFIAGGYMLWRDYGKKPAEVRRIPPVVEDKNKRVIVPVEDEAA